MWNQLRPAVAGEARAPNYGLRFSQISLTFKESVQSNKEKLDGGEAVVALSSQGSPAQQWESETKGNHLAVFT